MYIVKNALRCISRSKGRNILIGIIALVIAVSACIGLSIRQAAENATATTLEGMHITASISFDRSGTMNDIMGGMRPGSGGSFDRDQFADLMGSASSLTLEEYQHYATAASVEEFYYTLTAYVNGNDDFAPVSDESSDEDSSSSSGFAGMMGGMTGGMMPGGMGGFMGSRGDFTVVGYSADVAMTDFTDGISSIVDGSVFDEGTEELQCIISQELATYNNLAVGDTVVIANGNDEEETYELTVVGIYTSTTGNDFSMSMFGLSQDPANQIYMSAAALQVILDASAAASEDTAIDSTLDTTYVLPDVESYYAFEEEVRTLGLSEDYTVSSTDISAFENSLTPLKTLGTMAGGFLLVILAIGSVILVVLNIFNVRERKYEIGVLTAMGMKKWKVASQFVCEILVVTMIAVILGAGIGAVSSVPVTNALLESQIASQNSQMSQIENSFGRPGNMGGMMPGGMGGGMSGMPEMPDMGGPGNFPGGEFMQDIFGSAADYVTEVNAAVNLTVVVQMIGIGLLLTLIASAVSVLFVMRYDPLKILSNRD